MTEIVTIDPDSLSERSDASDELYALVFVAGGPLQKLSFGKLISKLIAADLCKPDEDALQADLAHVADQVALVINDPVAEKNGWWRKIGSSGTGYWSQFEALAKVVRVETQSQPECHSGSEAYG